MKRYHLFLILAVLLIGIIRVHAAPRKLSLREQLLRCTVRIETIKADGKKHTGTGFFFAFGEGGSNSIPVVATCKHVVEGAKSGTFFFSQSSTNKLNRSASHLPVTLPNFEGFWISHPKTGVDLAVFPIAPLQRALQTQGKNIDMVQIGSSLFPTQEELRDIRAFQPVVFVGYPIGIWDSTNNLPLARQGITASDPSVNYNSKPEFMIDGACYPGSSGSPVFLFNEGGYTGRSGMVLGSRLKFLGVLYAIPQYNAKTGFVVRKIPTALQGELLTPVPSGLGYVIKANELYGFDKVFEKILESQKKVSNQSMDSDKK